MPWAAVNRDNDRGVLSTTTSAGRVAASANCPSTYFAMVGYQDVGCSSVAQQMLPLDLALQGDTSFEGRKDRFVMEIADDYVADFRARSIGVGLARIGRAVGVYHPLEQVRFDQTLEFQGHAWVVRLLAASWVLLLPFAVTGAWWCRRKKLVIAPLLVALGVTVLSVGWVYGTVRFRASIEPLVVVLASVGAVAVWTEVKRGMGKRRMAR